MIYFDGHADRYDAWFDPPDGKTLFENELAALRLLWRDTFHPAREIGVGTGRFAQALGIKHGVDPARSALALASARGVETIPGRGEALAVFRRPLWRSPHRDDAGLLVRSSGRPASSVSRRGEVRGVSGISCKMDFNSPL
jgi:hypothetical protein